MSIILNIVLVLALVCLCIRLAKGNQAETVKSSTANEVYNTIMARTSVRSYQDKAVEPGKVDSLLRAGMAAPSAMNKQPWHFVAVTDREILDGLGVANPHAGMIKKAPLAIVVCGDLQKAPEGHLQQYWIQDASAATENILLAAQAMGLGAVWTGTYPNDDYVASVKELLNLPEHMIPLNTIVIGYPKGDATPKDKFKAENVSYNTFGGKK